MRQLVSSWTGWRPDDYDGQKKPSLTSVATPQGGTHNLEAGLLSLEPGEHALGRPAAVRPGRVDLVVAVCGKLGEDGGRVGVGRDADLLLALVAEGHGLKASSERRSEREGPDGRGKGGTTHAKDDLDGGDGSGHLCGCWCCWGVGQRVSPDPVRTSSPAIRPTEERYVLGRRQEGGQTRPAVVDEIELAVGGWRRSPTRSTSAGARARQPTSASADQPRRAPGPVERRAISDAGGAFGVVFKRLGPGRWLASN